MKYIVHTECKNQIKAEDEIYNFFEGTKFLINGVNYQNKTGAILSCKNRINTDFEMIYVVGGENRIEIDDQVYYGSVGDLFLIPPFTKHSIESNLENPHENYWIHFDLNPFYMVDNFLFAIAGGPHEFCINVGKKHQLITLFERIIEETTFMKPGYKLISLNLFMNFITQIFRANIEKMNSDNHLKYASKREKEIMEKASNYINSNLDKFITVRDIANELNISESFIYKIFSKCINLSPMNYMQLLRAKKAKLLIETTDNSMNEISDLLGFSSVYYFSNFFKKIYGQSPIHYRY